MPFLLHQLLTDGAERNPSQTAVVDTEGSLSYQELENLSNQLAWELIASGVQPGDRVGLYLKKSRLAVAGIIAAQKAGATYVPVDPHAPARRAAYILKNCSVHTLLISGDQFTRLASDIPQITSLASLVRMDSRPNPLPADFPPRLRVTWLAEVVSTQPSSLPDVPITDNHLAYILYTSGSTGEPKGVMISHLNSLTFVNWCYDTFRVQPTDRVSNHAPLHFDLSIFDIFCTLKAGGTVFLVPEDTMLFPVEMARWIAESKITIWYSVPSALIQLVEHGHLEVHNYESLRTVLFAGEVFPIKYLRRLVKALPRPRYFNLYGPTETNVCTFYEVQASDLDPGRTDPVPIGKACANTEVCAVDEHLKPIRGGEEGELFVRSSTVMKGYWGHPEGTAKGVIPNFLNPHYADVLYRTGDIVRLLPSGDYQYLGRKDKMIKSRGYRVELGEIEAALYAHPGVREAAVTAVPHEELGALIKAYVVAQNGLSRADLERFCSQRLPRYMIPSWFEFCSELPKTSTGKIDKTRLEKEKINV